MSSTETKHPATSPQEANNSNSPSPSPSEEKATLPPSDLSSSQQQEKKPEKQEEKKPEKQETLTHSDLSSSQQEEKKQEKQEEKKEQSKEKADEALNAKALSMKDPDLVTSLVDKDFICALCYDLLSDPQGILSSSSLFFALFLLICYCSI
jgi:hypothetical protein